MVSGFSFGGSGPNLAMIFVTLETWDERTGPGQSVAGLVQRLRGPLGKIGEARVTPIQPPAIRTR
ncbi:Toluene efflux pump membrane transporter TtgH [compost metagenome]